MKILYGVQATGNGHITRARCLSSELARQGARVDYLFSGRPADQLFDMAPFGTYQVREGLTFAIDNGRLDYWRTFRNARLQRFRDDVRQLDTRAYDLVITDFEPVTAWAARLQGTTSIGIGHQYAFAYNVPRDSDSLMASAVLRWFAPARHALGMHWHHFNAPILPPMIHCSMDTDPTLQSEQQVLVYLPFDKSASVLKMLRAHPTHQFHVFCADKAPGQYGNVHVHPFGRETFQQRLAQCASVITGAGFELTSEALHLGKRILVKPTRGQMEQMSNAHALRLLGLAETMNTLDTGKVGDWLQNGRKARVNYPDVAAALARWILAGDWTCRESLLAELWSDVEGLPEELTLALAAH
ncbi:MAG: glycosyltransferase [Natronospirillum sp.]|uniref:MJ1255/VC2487 family glycosyltransferase n=1 Tax=Natronospirillum sp. TaxID=2812955 RepID=UPI0025FECF40|nr:MJ1255/VC2487 family glycosyltransferase [Natronospirillum sp.]MCH8553015.1 glycosyltransferase [Natronospirillum sp.]